MVKSSFSLSKKLILLICIILLLIILPLFYIAKTSLTQFGSYAAIVNEEQVKDGSRFYLSRMAAEQAKNYNENFNKIKIASSLLGRQLKTIYDNMDVLSARSVSPPVVLELNKENNIFFNSRHDPVVTSFWGDKLISDTIQKELDAVSHFKPMLMKAKELVNESLAIHMITASGIGVYYTLNQKAKEAVYGLSNPLEFDLRQGEPVTVFTGQKTKLFDTQWTQIYKDDVIDGLMITATTPVYDQKGTFKGITGIDIPVRQIVSDLEESAFG